MTDFVQWTADLGPALSPLAALNMLREKDNQTIDGTEYWLDGPMNSPFSIWYPCASVNGYDWYPTDGLENPITETTTWIGVKHV